MQMGLAEEGLFERVVAPMAEAPWAKSAFWLYTVRIDDTRFGMTSRALLDSLEAGGIQSRPLWQPMHLSPAHRESFACECSVAEGLYRDCLSLPCSTNLTSDDQERVIEAVVQAASR